MTKRTFIPFEPQVVKFRDLESGTLFQDSTEGIYLKLCATCHAASRPFNAVLVGITNPKNKCTIGSFANIADECECWIIPEATFKLSRPY